MPAERSLVAERIEEIRLAKKLSRQALAERLKTTRLQVWRIETGVTEVSAEVAGKCADALGVPVSSLYRKAS